MIFFWILLIIIVVWVLWLSRGSKPPPFWGLSPLILKDPLPPSLPKKDLPPPSFPQLEPEKPKEFVSKGEKICCNVLSEIFNKPFTRVRPDFLKNPETSCNLELDCYNAELKLAVEYNGEQHYKFPHPFHKNINDFLKTVRRDRFKAEMCDLLGIYLIVVPYTVPHHQIREYIKYYLPDEVAKRKIISDSEKWTNSTPPSIEMSDPSPSLSLSSSS